MNRFYRICSFCRKSAIYLAAALCLPSLGYGQLYSAGCLDALRQGNGFKEIKLGADIAKIPGYKLNYLDDDTTMDADSCVKFAYIDSNILKMNNQVYLDLVGFRTYHNKIVNIYLFFRREDGHKILQNFVATYGKCTDKPADFVYNWSSGAVKLSLRYQAAVDLGVAIFTCNPIQEHLRIQKQKTTQAMSLSAVDTKSY